MKRNLKTTYLKSIGYLGSKNNIVDYNLNKSIQKFFRTFAKKLQENDLESMTGYFEEFDWDSYKPHPMKSYSEFTAGLISENHYHFGLLYKDHNDETQFLQGEFILDKRNRIKVKKIKSKTNQVIKLKMSKEEFMKLMPKKVNGIIPNTFSDVLKILGLPEIPPDEDD